MSDRVAVPLFMFTNAAETLKVREPWAGKPGLEIGITVPNQPSMMLSEFLPDEEVADLCAALLQYLTRSTISSDQLALRLDRPDAG